MAIPVNTSKSEQPTPKSRLAMQVNSGRKKAELIALKKAAATKKFNDELAAQKRTNTILAQREKRRRRSSELKLNNRARYILGGLVLNAIHVDGAGVFVVNASTLAALSDKERGLLGEVLFNLRQAEAAGDITDDATLAGGELVADKPTGGVSDGEVDVLDHQVPEIDICFDT